MATKGFFRKIPRVPQSPIEKACDILERLERGYSVRIPEGVQVRQEGNCVIVAVDSKNKREESQ